MRFVKPFVLSVLWSQVLMINLEKKKKLELLWIAVDLFYSHLQWLCTSLQKDRVMGNTSSERAAMCQGEKGRRDSRGNKEGERPKILMDSPEDADIFHGEDMKVSCQRHLFPSWLCLLTFIITKGTVNNTCLMGISGSYGERGVPCVAAGLGSGWQRTNAGPTNSLSLDWRRQGGLHLWIFQQLGQQDSPH